MQRQKNAVPTALFWQCLLLHSKQTKGHKILKVLANEQYLIGRKHLGFFFFFFFLNQGSKHTQGSPILRFLALV